MEQNLHGPEVYDFRQYDRIWQRVAPGLEPYPAGDGADTPARTEETGLMVSRQESQLPGAQADPCCMGSAAAEMLEVLSGFIHEELADQCALRALLRCAPVWAVARLREMAAETESASASGNSLVRALRSASSESGCSASSVHRERTVGSNRSG